MPSALVRTGAASRPIHRHAPAARRRASPPTRTEIGTAPDPVGLSLEIWKNWLAGDSDRDLGAKTMRGLVGPQQASDIKVAMATDAMISSLGRLRVRTIHRSCSLTAVRNFPNVSLVEVAEDARSVLDQKLLKIAVRQFFSK